MPHFENLIITLSLIARLRGKMEEIHPSIDSQGSTSKFLEEFTERALNRGLLGRSYLENIMLGKGAGFQSNKLQSRAPIISHRVARITKQLTQSAPYSGDGLMHHLGLPSHRLWRPVFFHQGGYEYCTGTKWLATRATSSEGAARQDAAGEGLDTIFLLDRVYQSVFGGVQPSKEVQWMMTMRQKGGKGITTDSSGGFRLRIADGAFILNFVEIRAADGTTGATYGVHRMQGFDGEGPFWTWDNITQQRTELDLDDNDASILFRWTGEALYALPHIRDRLNFEVLTPAAAQRIGAQEGEVCLAVQLKRSASPVTNGTPVTAYSFISTQTWLPTRAYTDYRRVQRLTMELSAWRPSEEMPSFYLATTKQIDSDGVQIEERISSVKSWHGCSGEATSSASQSQVQLEPIPVKTTTRAQESLHAECPNESSWRPSAEDPYSGPAAGHDPSTGFDIALGNEVKAQLTPRGNMAIAARINGRDVGYWVLDTGSSGNFMSELVAKELDLATIGECNVALVGGFSKATVAQVENFTAGPMTMTDTTFTVIDLTGIQSGNVKLAGILGYDFFRRAIIEIQNDASSFFGTSKHRVFIYDPGQPTELERGTVSPLKIVSDMPYVETVVQGDCNCLPSTGLMMLDLGATATCLSMTTEGARNAGVLAPDNSNVKYEGMMIGAGGQSLRYKEAAIKYVEIAGSRIYQPDMTVSIIDSDVADMAVRSNFAHGVVNMDLFKDCRIVIDYPGKNIGVELLNDDTAAFDSTLPLFPIDDIGFDDSDFDDEELWDDLES